MIALLLLLLLLLLAPGSDGSPAAAICMLTPTCVGSHANSFVAV